MLTGLDLRRHVKQYRDEHSLTQVGLAQRVGCSPSRIAQVESGHIPSPELSYRLAEVCGLDPGEVLTWAVTQRLGRAPVQELVARNTPQVLSAMRGARARLCVEGITCIRRIRNVKEDLVKLVDAGGDLRVAILDPACRAFRKRRRDESVGDKEQLPEGKVTLRMDHEAHVVGEILKALYHRACLIRPGQETVRLRTYTEYPRASITIVDKTMVQYYRYRKGHRGKRQDVRLVWEPAHELFRQAEAEFEALWDRSDPVPLGLLEDDEKTLPFERAYGDERCGGTL